MENPISLSFVQSSAIVLSTVCRQACGYCSFHTTEGGILPLKDLNDRLFEIRAAKAVEVQLISGEFPQEYPQIQMALKREECGSFIDYLEKACRLALQLDLLPVAVIGRLDAFLAKKLAEIAAAVRIDVVPADLSQPGEAHDRARGRNPAAGRDSIEQAHHAQLPYHLGIMIGIGETDEQRHEFIKELGRFCAADPYLQDIRLIPFQPMPGTRMHDRPPLPFEAVAATIQLLKEQFPVHQISAAPHLFSRFADLIPFGLNDLGSIPIEGRDPGMPSFPYPTKEEMQRQSILHNFMLQERLPLTTVAGYKRTHMAAAFESCQYRLKNRTSSMLELADDNHCFGCGKKNPASLNIEFQMCGPFLCTTTWKGTSTHQGYSGMVHGGILATLLDELMGQCLIRSGVRVVTADMAIRYLKPTPIDVPLIVTGTRVGGRKNLHLTKGTIRLADGSVLVEAEGRYVER